MKAEQGSALIDMLYERPNGPWVMASSLQEILPHACIKAGIERDRGWRSYDSGGGGASAPHRERREETAAAWPGKIWLRLIIGRLGFHVRISATIRDSPPIYPLWQHKVRGRINPIYSLFVKR